MSKAKTMTLTLKRVIPAVPAKVYAAWMDPKQACNPWNHGKKLVFSPKVNGLFYVLMQGGTPHFGRFTGMARGRQVSHTWMSPYTRGLESAVTVTFKKQGTGTLMTLRHGGLPNDDFGMAHNDGWGYFLGQIEKRFKAKR